MQHSAPWRPAHRPALLTFFGLLALLLVPLVAPSAELPSYTGYTRPGNPSDTVEGGKVIPAANIEALRKTALGGTVYYMVLQRGGTDGDPWGTGHPDFLASYRPGIDFNGTSSPGLDTSAKYLYLYQTVNDRHTGAPIQSTSVKLIVDLKEITSWGYFSGIGFGTAAADEGEKAAAIRPVSFSNILAASDQDLAYKLEAPAVAAPRPYRLTSVPTRRGEGAPKAAKGDKRILTLFWDPLDPANNPDHVMLLASSDFKGGPSFRAIWNGDNVLKRDGRSTVFGFTSNLPPTIEPVRIRGVRSDDKEKEKEGGIRPAADAMDPEVQEAGFGANGKAPTPRPEEGTSMEMPPLLPTSPGQPASTAAPVGTSGTPSGAGGSNLGQAPPPVIGTPSNFGGSQQQQAQQQQQQQQQAQQQQQQQQQAEVVPQPAALVLAAIGLPFLLLFRRRKT